MAGQSLLIILFVGLVAGWLAGLLVQGGGLGLVGDLLVGIVGAFIGHWLFAHFHIHFGSGIGGAIIQATIGAMLLLALIRLVGGVGGGYRYGRRY